MIEECLQDGGGVFLGSGPQRLLKPHRVKALFPGNLIPRGVQELCDFPSKGRLDRLGFFYCPRPEL